MDFGVRSARSNLCEEVLKNVQSIAARVGKWCCAVVRKRDGQEEAGWCAVAGDVEITVKE